MNQTHLILLLMLVAWAGMSFGIYKSKIFEVNDTPKGARINFPNLVQSTIGSLPIVAMFTLLLFVMFFNKQ